ncbi:protein phosphatase 1 regulatory subunit 3B [Mustelus asterias]
MEEPDPAISPAVHQDLQTDLKVALSSCSSHSLQLSLGASSNTSSIKNCSTGSCNANSCDNRSKNCSTISFNTSSFNASSGCNTNKNCNTTSCNTNSSCNTNRNCSTTSCNTSSGCSTTSCNTNRNCSTTSCNSSKGCNSSNHSNNCKISNCKTSCNSQAGDEGKVCELSRQPDAMCPEKEVLVSAASRQSNELRLNRRRTKSLPCLHDPSDFFSEFNGGLRKKVKFADSLGLSLASVKHFRASDEPYIPSKVFLRLQSFPTIVDDLNEKFKALGIHCLRPTFSMPCEASDFMQRAERNRICLENVTVSHFDVHGLIRVLNTSYIKEVAVRYTFNNWLSCMETPAKFVEGSSHLGTDQFSFVLSIPPFLDQGSFVHFAICYRADNEEYWDNNFDKNYSLQCESTSDEHANT